MSYQRSIRNEEKEKTYLFSMNPYLARTKRFQVLIFQHVHHFLYLPLDFLSRRGSGFISENETFNSKFPHRGYFKYNLLPSSRILLSEK